MTQLHIDRLSPKGRGIAHFQQTPQNPISQVEVLRGIPGDEVQVELGKKKRGKYTSLLKSIITPSPSRVAPRCSHAEYCGGCSVQQMDYAAQLREKQALVEKAFSGFQGTIHPIIPSDSPWEYRNKMEFSFSENRAGEQFLGLMIAGAKSKVFNLQECHLASPWFSQALIAVREWWKKSGLRAYRLSDEGSLRTLILRESRRTGDKMAMLTVSGNPQYAVKKSQVQEFIKTLKGVLPEKEQARLSIFLRIQQIAKGSPTQFFEIHLHGPDHIEEILTIDTGEATACLTFKISPTSFFQPNTNQAEVLYSKAIQMLRTYPSKEASSIGGGFLADFRFFFRGVCTRLMLPLQKGSKIGSKSSQNRQKPLIEIGSKERAEITNRPTIGRVLDLYCGTGTLSMAMATLAKEVIGIELNPHSIFDAESNRERNQIKNLRFIQGDVGKKLGELSDRHFDVVVVDPPRVGLEPPALAQILSLQADKILYISCNPASQAENIKVLVQGGYELLALQPVDQFPHTMHIENIAVLQKRLISPDI